LTSVTIHDFIIKRKINSVSNLKHLKIILNVFSRFLAFYII